MEILWIPLVKLPRHSQTHASLLLRIVYGTSSDLSSFRTNKLTFRTLFYYNEDDGHHSVQEQETGREHHQDLSEPGTTTHLQRRLQTFKH